MASVPARQLFHQSHTYNWIRRARSPSSIPVRSPFRSYTTNTPPTSPTPTHATDLPKPKLRGWRKYAHQFRDKPASYIVSFAVLHELTAILPIPLVYFFLDKTGTRIPFPEDAIAEGNRIFSRLRVRYGYEPLDSQSRVMINLATSYAVVKVYCREEGRFGYALWNQIIDMFSYYLIVF